MAVDELSPTGSQSFSDVAACTADSEHLLAAIVVDESLSLRSTDPNDLRVDAIVTALDSLERLTANSGGELDVQASLSVFGERTTTLVGWGPTEGAHLESLRSAARDELPTRDGARLTDYRRALADAQKSLDDRATAAGGTSCKIVLWLTDGKLDVDGRGDRPATDSARVELCEPGGIADGLRADDVAIIAMGLMTLEGDGAVTPLDRDRLQAIAEGSGGAETCGSVPVAGDVTNGAFLNADDAGALARLFAQMGALLEGGQSTATYDCPSDDCVDGRLAIPVDAGVGGFRVVAQSEEGAAPMQLVAPDGATAVLEAPTVQVGGAESSVLVNGSLTTVDVRQVGSRTGTWTLITDPTATTVIDLYHFWGVTLTVEAPNEVVIGEVSPLRITARTPDGAPVPLNLYESVAIEVTIDGEAATFRPDGEGWAGEIAVPADAAASSMAISGRATAVTTPSGLTLGPVAVQDLLVTQFPPSFPGLTPAELDLGRLDGATSAQAVVTLTGSERGPTRACFAPGVVSAPERAGSVTLAAGAECVDIEAGASRDVTVELSTQNEADGRVSGTLPVTLHGVDGGDPIEAQVPVTATMVRPVDVAAQLWLVAAFTAVALALAYASAVLARRWLGRFNLGTETKFAEAPVRITPRGIERTDGATALLSSEEFRQLPVKGKHRTFKAGPVTHRVHYPWNPLAEPQALVESPGRVPMTHIVKEHRDPRVRRTELPGSAGFVVLTERPEPHHGEDELRGTLVMVVDPGRDSVASLLPHRLTEFGRVTWDREVTRARNAWAEVTSSAPTRTPRGGNDRAVGPSPRDAVADDIPVKQGPPPPRSGTAASYPPLPRDRRGPANPPPPPKPRDGVVPPPERSHRGETYPSAPPPGRRTPPPPPPRR
ncbi:vWA domain-containing protein [Georgenia muralis]